MLSSGVPISLLSACLLTFIVGIIQKASQWRRVRAHYRRLPGPPHSFWFGHARVLSDVLARLPPKTHPQVACALLCERYRLPNVFYLDVWPFSDPYMVVQDPAVATQITQLSNLPKHPIERNFLRNMTGKRSLVGADGPEWKALRFMFNPGFSATHLTAMVPRMMKHLVAFQDRLYAAADSGKVIKLQDFAALTTIDVVGEAAIGVNLEAQNKHSPIADHFRKAIALTGSGFDPIGRMTSFIPQWWYCRNLDKALQREILARYDRPGFDDWGQRAIPDLILTASKAGKLKNTIHEAIPPDYHNPEFMQLAVNNIKTLLLGGHDTSASSLCYTVYLLSLHPQCLAAVRGEHDSVFGPDPVSAADRIVSQPNLLNQLHYTTACIREALRLFPPGATVRTSTPNTIQSVVLDGLVYPLEGNALWITHFGMGRRADLWPEPYSFKPERFMPGYSPEPFRDAFRPFEKGPRACIGVELAYIELKIMLILISRSFDIEAAYSPDAPRADEKWGGVVYPIMELAPKPAGHMPVKVRRRGVEE